MCCEISVMITRADICVARYLSCSLQRNYVLRDNWLDHYNTPMWCEISEFFSTPYACVARYQVVYYSRRVCCETSVLISQANVGFERYLICTLKQTYMLRDIWVVHYSRRMCCEFLCYSLQQTCMLRDMWFIHHSSRMFCEISEWILQQSFVMNDIEVDQ